MHWSKMALGKIKKFKLVETSRHGGFKHLIRTQRKVLKGTFNQPEQWVYGGDFYEST